MCWVGKGPCWASRLRCMASGSRCEQARTQGHSQEQLPSVGAWCHAGPAAAALGQWAGSAGSPWGQCSSPRCRVTFCPARCCFIILPECDKYDLVVPHTVGYYDSIVLVFETLSDGSFPRRINNCYLPISGTSLAQGTLKSDPPDGPWAGCVGAAPFTAVQKAWNSSCVCFVQFAQNGCLKRLWKGCIQELWLLPGIAPAPSLWSWQILWSCWDRLVMLASVLFSSLPNVLTRIYLQVSRK